MSKIFGFLQYYLSLPGCKSAKTYFLMILLHSRFVYEGQWRNKISAYVDFPVKGLELSQFVLGPGCKPYKLYGISVSFRCKSFDFLKEIILHPAQ